MNNNEIYNVYINILDNYTINFTKNLYDKLKNNINNLEFIFKNGLSILSNIYMLMIIKNKNKLFIINICDKIFIYYIEFINQIYSNSQDNTILLSLYDAKIFCYKKFINELENSESSENNQNNEKKKNCNQKFRKKFLHY